MHITLDQILVSTRRRVDEAKKSIPLRQLEQQAQHHSPRGFASALRNRSQHGAAIIAELKKASPSKGLIREKFDPSALAVELVEAGAAALSVLTNEEFFQGSLSYLRDVSSEVKVPLLRKDFILDEYQIVEARAYCADAILLIVAALSEAELRKLYGAAREFGLDVLCEVHDEHELQRAVACKCDIIGVNSRDLRNFKVDLNTAFRLAEKIPDSAVRVAESGIASAENIAKLRRAGFNAFLIGESLMRVERPGAALQELLQPKTVAR